MKKEIEPDLERIFACPLCSCLKFKKVLAKFSLQLVRCKQCSLVFTNPRLRPEKILERYSSNYFFQEYLKPLKNQAGELDLNSLYNRYHLYLQILKKFFSPGKKLLEIGSAAGFFLYFAHQDGWHVRGVEYIPEAAQYARDNFGLSIYEASFEEAKIEEEFDFVALLDVLEHFSEPLFCLKKVRQLLKPGGLLLISTPNYNSLSRFFLGKGWAVLSPADHLFYFSKKTIRLLLNRAGFEIIGLTDISDFNAENVHKEWRGIGYLIYKKLVKRYGQSYFLNKIREREFNEFLGIDEFSTGQINQYSGLKKTIKLSKKIFYDLLKTIISGDKLLVLASKS